MPKIVIDVPDRDYKAIKEIPDNSMFRYDNIELLKDAIRNGTVLPRSHGRLIDSDNAKAQLRPFEEDDDETFVTIHTAKKLCRTLLDKAPTVLEPDKE